MKVFLIAFSILISNSLLSQVLKDTATYAFPIGSKFTLELIKVNEKEFKYHVLKLEPINYAIDYSKTDSLFALKPEKGTIECYFAKGIDQKGPFKTVLILRNNTGLYLDYKAEIAYEQRDGFFSTSVEPLFPGVKSSELWNNQLTAILIHNISKKE
jgi:hypothetical protein